MKLKPKLLPRIALGAGVLGFVLQLWLLAAGIDERGLIRSSHPAIILLLLLTAGTIAVLGLGAKPLTQQPKNEKLFSPSMPACVGSCVAAAGVLISAFIRDVNLFAILAALVAAACLVLTGLSRRKPHIPNHLGYVAITAYLVLYLMQQYQHWNTEPQLLRYFFPLLALISLMITLYYRAALEADSGNFRLFVFFHWCALFFCCISIAGSTWPFYLGMTLWLATWDCSYETKIAEKPMVLPDEVIYCIDTLTNAGYRAYVVGGCVRDHLLGLKPHDYDLCTSATPEEICNLFARHDLVRNGEKHGTIGVVLAGTLFEITTFRTEGGYTDSRHPDWVEFVADIKEDLARRDFTVNAMAYSEETGLIDPFGGQKDLQAGILRAVGVAEHRFDEDALRILRGLRFAARFGFSVEEATVRAMKTQKHLLRALAAERVWAELVPLLCAPSAVTVLRQFRDVFAVILPELEPMFGFDQQNKHHQYDVWEHTLHTLEHTPAEPVLRLVMLLHDCGKPARFTIDFRGDGHFYGHAAEGARRAEEALSRLRCDKETARRVVRLIFYHDHDILDTEKSLLRWLRKVGERDLRDLLTVKIADNLGQHPRYYRADRFRAIGAHLDALLAKQPCFDRAALAVTGRDLLPLGYAGPGLGAALDRLVEAVIEGRVPNEKAALLEFLA